MGLSLRSTAARLAMAAAAIVAAAALSSQEAPRERVGPLADGGFLLNSGWRLHPAGKQIPLDTLPMSTALSRDGKYLLALNAGYNPPSISVIDTTSQRVVSSARVPDGWLGLAFAPHTDRVYVGGGSQAAVFEFTLNGDGSLTPGRTFEVVPKASRTDQDFVGDIAFSPDGRLLYAAQLYRNSIAVINPLSGMVTNHFPTLRRPYRILFHPDGKSFFVSHWADRSVGLYDASTGERTQTVRLGDHPTDMVWREGEVAQTNEGEAPWVARLFVAAANTNNVYSVGLTESNRMGLVETINISMTAMQPVGMTPSALALSPDAKTLYVACSDANAAAVIDISEERSHVAGFIPTGWYPTAVRALGSGALVVLNGKGARSYPAPHGPNPEENAAPVQAGVPARQYVASMQTGSASWIDAFDANQLAAWTQEELADSPYTDARLLAPNSLPAIEHVIYIVKENRTYDQVLGDMKQGNGDPSLVLFGENVTPNLHKIARQFVLLDNFYVNSDVSADGHAWSTAAIAPDYTQKLWPNSYAKRRETYDYEETDPASLPPAGYLWTGASQAGLTIRNFGYMVTNAEHPAPGAAQVSAVRDPVLAPVTERAFRGFDLAYPDVERAKVFLADLAADEKSGQMPRLTLIRLGNDHTSGAEAGAIAPLSAAADNDQAVGMLVEGVSKSRFWNSTAIFIVEDDAQDGPDHVDSHRSPAFVISPYVKRGLVDSTMYNTTSVLRTMELLLGLRPMTDFDAGARPMTSLFQATPDPAPYAAEQPRISLTERNPKSGPGAAAARHMDFEEADLNDDDELNDVIWRAIRHDAPPPPTRSYFGR
ncbi:MAG TPA: bifunctional YncE family protein/alkaline phosphatase family protein [Bryobacteraceae bacterium]|nr:bifunctional YncE family protein/alkaline phosphatase family protein [Bryobacteraceae bacterium]